MRVWCVALALCAAPVQADTLRLMTEAAFPPFNFLNDRGEVDGFDRAVGDELCRRIAADCVWVVRDWDALIPELMGGNADVILAAMTITDERRAVIAFTQAYVPPAPSAFVARTTDADLAGAVAAQAGSVHADFVAASGAALLEYPTTDDVVAAVRRGEAEAGFADQPFLDEMVAGSAGSLVIARGGIPLGEGFGLGLRQSDGPLRERIDAALTAMKQDGSLNALLRDWHGDAAMTF